MVELCCLPQTLTAYSGFIFLEGKEWLTGARENGWVVVCGCVCIACAWCSLATSYCSLKQKNPPLLSDEDERDAIFSFYVFVSRRRFQTGGKGFILDNGKIMKNER